MTKPVSVTVGNKEFEVRIVIKDSEGRRVRMPKDFFKNAKPDAFVDMSGKLLKSFDKYSQITWIDGKGALYKGKSEDPEALSDSQETQWKKVEDYILTRYGKLPEEAFVENDETDAVTDLDDSLGAPNTQKPRGTTSAANPALEQPGTPASGPATNAALQAFPTATTGQLPAVSGPNPQSPDPISTAPLIPAHPQMPPSPVTLTPIETAGLTPTQIAALTPSQMAAITAPQIRALTLPQVAALTPSQIGGLTPQQVGAMSPAQINALNPLQIAPLPGSQLPSNNGAVATEQTLRAQENAARQETNQTLAQMLLAQQNAGSSKSSSITPSYPKVVHGVVDNWFDWILSKIS